MIDDNVTNLDIIDSNLCKKRRCIIFIYDVEETTQNWDSEKSNAHQIEFPACTLNPLNNRQTL